MSSAQARIEARVRSRRRRRVGVVLLVVTVVTGLGWMVLGSPWLRVERVEVAGTSRLDRAVVEAAVAGERGRPLALARTDEVARRIESDPLVLGVVVKRSWPSTLTVSVQERRPVAAVRRGASVDLLDVDGVLVGVEAAVPAGLPLVEVNPMTARGGTIGAVVTVLGSLPPSLAPSVRRSGASTPDDVWLVLADGARVIWGSAEQSALKATVVERLRATGAAVYDVSAPGTPAVSGSLHKEDRTRTTKSRTTKRASAAAVGSPRASATRRAGAAARTSATAPTAPTVRRARTAVTRSLSASSKVRATGQGRG